MNGTGCFEPYELRDAINKITNTTEVSVYEAQELVKLFDTRGSGTINFDEFIHMMTQLQYASESGEGARDEKLLHAYELVFQFHQGSHSILNFVYVRVSGACR